MYSISVKKEIVNTTSSETMFQMFHEYYLYENIPFISSWNITCKYYSVNHNFIFLNFEYYFSL